MAWDIYGERLTPGFCECHPWVREEWPCTICVMEQNAAIQQRREYDEAIAAEYQAQCESMARDEAENAPNWCI